MEIEIYARNLQLNSEAQSYIQKKFGKLERHLKPISNAKLEVSRTSARSPSQRIVAQMTLTAHGHTLRGQESGVNLFAAIDAVTDVVDRQIQRYKGKIYEAPRQKHRAGQARPLGVTYPIQRPRDSVRTIPKFPSPARWSGPRGFLCD